MRRSLSADGAVEADELSPMKLLPSHTPLDANVCICCFSTMSGTLKREDGKYSHQKFRFYSWMKSDRNIKLLQNSSLLLHVFCFSNLMISSRSTVIQGSHHGGYEGSACKSQSGSHPLLPRSDQPIRLSVFVCVVV